MNLRDLNYLVALAEFGHFGKAAEACFVSQPALSMQIKKLEEYLGVTLVERTSKATLLTEVGKEIADKASQVLDCIKDIHEITEAHAKPYTGELKIGIFPTLAPYLLPIIVPMLTRTFPLLKCFWVEEKSAVILEKLKAGKLHAAFLAEPELETSLTTLPVFEEPCLLTVAHHHPLATHTCVDAQALLAEPFMLLEEGHCLREQVLAFCSKHKIVEKNTFRASSLESLRYMIAAGHGISLMPQLACKPVEGLRYIPFENVQPVRRIEWVYRSKSAKQTLLKEMAEHISAWVAPHLTNELNN